jgi:hypothetical protein
MTTAAAKQQQQTDLADARRIGFSRLPMATQRRIMATLDPNDITEILDANPKYKIGDEIGINDPKFPGIWIVEKVNPTRYLLAPKAGGRGLRAPHGMACAAPEGPASSLLQPYVPVELFNLGQFVRYIGTKTIAGIGPGGLGVVVGDTGGQRVRVAKLGGSDDLMQAARQNLRPVSLAEVAEYLALPVGELVTR